MSTNSTAPSKLGSVIARRMGNKFTNIKATEEEAEVDAIAKAKKNEKADREAAATVPGAPVKGLMTAKLVNCLQSDSQ